MAAANDKQLLAHILSIPGLRLAGGPAPVAAAAVTAEQPPAKRAKRTGDKVAEETADVASSAQPQAPSLAPPAVAPMLLEPVTETLECPTSCVGYVIGKGGMNVKGVQQVTGAAVQVAKRDEGDGGIDGGTREITLTGTPVAVSLARSMLEQIIAQGQKRSRGAEQQQQPTREERIAVEAGKAGWLIGPGGANIKAIRLLSGARVDVLDEVTHTGARKSTAVVSGTEQQLADARLALQGLIGAVNSVASKTYAEQLVRAAKQRSDILAAQAAPVPVSEQQAGEGAAAGDIHPSEPGQGGGDGRREAGWVRMLAQHPDGQEVAFWHHPESGMMSW